MLAVLGVTSKHPIFELEKKSKMETSQDKRLLTLR
jgi:hypothetical protein